MRFSDETLARRLEAVSDRFMRRWVEGLPVRFAPFGAASAVASPERGEVDFMNRVIGLWPEDADQVDGIAAWYRGLGVRGWFELAPAEGFDRLAGALARAGAAQIGFHARLCGAVPGSTSIPNGVRVEESPDPAVFADVLLRGHDVPEEARRTDGRAFEHGRVQGWRLYVAYVDDTPAGAAVLTLDDGIGYLANASTLPAFRRRGVQNALIAHRLADAAAHGCELIASGTDFGSQSQRNLERAGLQITYTKAVWRLH
jgi:ribosomal protein S18 acetylase RimI-like enzyme